MLEYKAITMVCKVYYCVCANFHNRFTYYYSYLYSFLLFLLSFFSSFFRLTRGLFWGFKANQQRLILLGSSQANCVFLYLYF